jgi:hypothetical protein
MYAVRASRRAAAQPGSHLFLYVHSACVIFDPAKNERDIRERGLSFEETACCSFDTALYAIDRRQEFAEVRYVAVGLLGDRLHVLCFTEAAEGIRVISFRKANAREVKRYAQALAAD